MKSLMLVVALSLPLTVMAGGEHHKPNKPEPKPPAPVTSGDSVHHESRSSKLAKVAGVLALVGITYHLAWGGKPEQNKGKITFEPRKE